MAVSDSSSRTGDMHAGPPGDTPALIAKVAALQNLKEFA